MEIKVSQSSDGKEEYLLLSNNGELISASWIGRRINGEYYLSLPEYEDFEQFSQHLFSNVPEEIVQIYTRNVGYDDFTAIESFKKTNNYWVVRFQTQPSIEEWARGYGFREYFDEFKRVAQERIELEIDVEPEEILDNVEYIFGGFFLNVKTKMMDSRIGDEVAYCEEKLQKLIDQVEASLNAKNVRNSLVTYFSFPKEVEVACEQYLLYFVQFLRDLGLEATANLHHEAGSILFAVTPSSKDDALEKIRSAFDIYLQLPANPISIVSADSENRVAVQRLAANVHHLNGQLMLAQSVIEAKNATIQAQSTTIEFQQRLLDGSVIIDSRVDQKESKKDDKEVILGGTVAITKLQGKGVEINLPEIFRRLKKLFNEEN